jgi:hypothetical protein
MQSRFASSHTRRFQHFANSCEARRVLLLTRSPRLALKGPPCHHASFGSGMGHETRGPPMYAPRVAVCLIKVGLCPRDEGGLNLPTA